MCGEERERDIRIKGNVVWEKVRELGRGAKERLCVGRVVCVLTERGGTKGKKTKVREGE